MSTKRTRLETHHILSLFIIVLAIAMTACQGKRGYEGPPTPAPQSLQIDSRKLAPIKTEQLLPAKELLKNLGSTIHLERYFLSDASPDSSHPLMTELQSRCTIAKAKVAPKIDPEKVRVGAQFDFSRHYQAQGESCPMEMLRHMEANLTFWSIDKANQSGTVRTRAEVQLKTRLQDPQHQKSAGYSELDLNLRVVEDGKLGEPLKAHLRVFGGGPIDLTPGGRVELRVRGEQLKDGQKKNMILRIRAKTAANETFNYAVQWEELNGESKIVKAYIGNVPLTEGEIRDLKVAGLVERFNLSVQ